MNLLEFVDISLLQQGYQIGLDWLGKFVRVIIESVGIIGVGIICFTLILKAVTLPFDIYQRVKTRKQTLIMREMKPELEKLQKQYANDKTTYNQKMMELYKKNGYSMLGACLPMIISLVILIVAFQAFRAYSQFANLDFFVQMSNEYNAAVLVNGEDGIDLALQTDEDGNFVTDGDAVTFLWEDDAGEPQKKSVVWENGTSFTVEGSACEYVMTDVIVPQVIEGETQEVTVKYLQVIPTDPAKFINYRYSLETTAVVREYRVDAERLKNALPEDSETRIALEQATTREAVNEICSNYVVTIGGQAAKTWYELPENNPGFLWIKNVWYPDVSYNHPIPTYENFIKQFGDVSVQFEDGSARNLESVLTSENYRNLTSALTEEKEQANGYFILIILSIGLMVVSQLITMKSQKESAQYQTVNGAGAKTQKIMLVAMPLIYALFAFMYSAAFSIYMVISSLFSIVVTLLSNLIIGRVFRKKEEEQIKKQYSRSLPWMKDDKAKNKTEKKSQREKNGRSR